MIEKTFSKGDVIFREGDKGECLYSIIDGVVGIYVSYGTDSPKKLTDLGKGKVFGEMAVIEAYSRSATAVAEDDVKVLEISSGEVAELFKTRPDSIVDIMRHLCGRIRELSADLAEVNRAIAESSATEAEDKKETLLEKIKKFAAAYKNSKKPEYIDSIESLRKSIMAIHSEGFSKRIDSFEKGTVIFKQGEIGKCMYDIHSGKIGIYSNYNKPNEKLLTELGPNKFFGEIGMLEEDRHSATAVALENDTTLEVITAGDLMELFEKNPPKVEMILAHMSYRLRKLTDEYMDACKLAYEVTQAEGRVSDEAKEQAAAYQEKLYD